MAADGIEPLPSQQRPPKDRSPARRGAREERGLGRGGGGGGGDRLVYSSSTGRVRPRERPAAAASGDGFVRVRREVKGRRGKTVTTAEGIPLSDAELRALASELKRRCGSGGSAGDGMIEIQGDHRDFLVAELERRGFRVKRAGG